ncbi:MAG: T9SS type A sorting domain-containing protein [Melioribacteraceae bacterium]|nr:T9SS type A sorting domain-containing protein [Melioribacteraceae bacterium]MCF8394116.1 T9SS type A sorting domain-containing protein [Melioribacteraceae bacterium]MCF8418146.1 T9SS type A sorting domain-containing protein [Melioribacteraceae bacterium]
MKNLFIIFFVPFLLYSQNPTFRDINIVNENIVFVVGDDGTILRTTDSGNNWEDVSFDTNESFMEIESCKSKLWIRAHLSDKIYYSEDLGNSWIEITQFDDDYILNMKFISDSLAFLTAGVNKIYKSTDNGISWQQIDGSYYSAGPIDFINNNIGWIGGFNVIYSTSDGGNTWYMKGLDVFELDIRELQLLDHSIGFVVGDGNSNNNVNYGMFAMTENNGESWYKKTFDKYVQDLHFFNEDSGIIITDYNILNTSDKGRNWDTLDVKLYSFEFSNNKSWGLSNDGKILFSDDRWETWVQQYPQASSVSDELVSSYTLSQNYPNPFNPSTKINYSISESGQVNIALYDILGKHINTYVDEFKLAGNYSLEINGSKLSSGIYIYKMVINNFSSTKKLLFIK